MARLRNPFGGFSVKIGDGLHRHGKARCLWRDVVMSFIRLLALGLTTAAPLAGCVTVGDGRRIQNGVTPPAWLPGHARAVPGPERAGRGVVGQERQADGTDRGLCRVTADAHSGNEVGRAESRRQSIDLEMVT